MVLATTTVVVATAISLDFRLAAGALHTAAPIYFFSTRH